MKWTILLTSFTTIIDTPMIVYWWKLGGRKWNSNTDRKYLNCSTNFYVLWVRISILFSKIQRRIWGFFKWGVPFKFGFQGWRFHSYFGFQRGFPLSKCVLFTIFWQFFFSNEKQVAMVGPLSPWIRKWNILRCTIIDLSYLLFVSNLPVAVQ
jgi:hypothetical protein